MKKMRLGNESSYKEFTRSTDTENGDEQSLFMTYAPVMLRSLRAKNHSDFAAGVEERTAPVYALGFGISVEDLAIAFAEVEEQVNRDVTQVGYISLALILGALLLVM